MSVLHRREDTGWYTLTKLENQQRKVPVPEVSINILDAVTEEELAESLEIHHKTIGRYVNGCWIAS